MSVAFHTIMFISFLSTTYELMGIELTEPTTFVTNLHPMLRKKSFSLSNVNVTYFQKEIDLPMRLQSNRSTEKCYKFA